MNRDQFVKIAIGLFWLVAVIDVIAIIIEAQQLERLVKPALMGTLILYFIGKGQNVPAGLTVLMVAALLFALLGDVFMFLNSSNPLYLAYGMAAFMVMHLLYIILFNVAYVRRYRKKVVVRRPILALPIIIYSAIIFDALILKGDYQSPQSWFSPVLAYGLYILIICLMGLSAQNRVMKTTTVSFWEVFGGVLLFMLSDTLIAFREFMHWELLFGDALIMITYILAQYLIVRGIIRHYDSLAAGWVRYDMRQKEAPSIIEEFVDPV